MVDWGLLLSTLFSIKSLLVISGGILGGMLAGALPGISGTMAVTLLLPFTFAMEPSLGIMLLMAIYAAAVYGGSISAILINTPGTTSSAATALDGYKMTEKGKGAQALRISTFTSMMGGLVSAFALLLLSPPLSKVSLWFGPPEYLLMACLGLAAVATLSTDSIIKGIMGGILGLFLASVGIDYMLGFPRFTFGFVSLEGGISFVPALIGFFALSEVMAMGEKRFEPARGAMSFVNDRMFPTREDIQGLWPTIGRGSVIGVIIGILPGAGADIGSWISYNIAKRVSRFRDEIGHGSRDGVAASEVANNAVTGASLIPLLTMGIPGSAVAAVILGGLMIHGLVPGRELFTVHAQITYTAIYGFILSNLMVGLFGFLLIKPFTQVTRISRRHLAPLIVMLCVVGSFAIHNNFFDVGTMVFFGMIGYVMKKGGFHPAPVVLAMVLGPMAESRYMQTSSLCDGQVVSYMLGRPLSVFLILLIVLFLIAPMFYKGVKTSG